MRVRGADEVKALAGTTPLLLLSNHTSWWDPLVAIHVCQHVLQVDGYAMMDGQNLERLPFFGLVGAFGVDLSSTADGARVVRYAAKLLSTSGRAVWVFPQGGERPVTAPLVFKPGAAAIARVAKSAATIPIGLRYEHAGDERPHLYVSFGAPVPPGRDTAELTQRHEAAVAAELSQIERAVCGDDDGFVTLHRRAPSVAARFLERALARLTRSLGGPPRLPAASRDDRT